MTTQTNATQTNATQANTGAAFVPHDLAAPIKGAARGPLAGLTVAVKDMYDLVGERSGGGSPDWLAAQKPATRNATAMQKLLDAGATIVGKAICEEFFYSVTGINAHYGAPNNPRAPGRMPGGSSSGSASACAAGACDIAIGSDTGGSVRIPASFCGLYGLRPTLGRIDVDGVMPMAESFDMPGWFACGPGVFRNVGDVLLIGRRNHAPIRRLLVHEEAFTQTDPDVAALVRRGLAAMAQELPKPEQLRVKFDDLETWWECIRIVQAREVWENYGTFITAHKPNIGPGTRERMAFCATVTEAQTETARGIHRAAREQVRSIVQPGTIVALPTAPCIAPRLDSPQDTLDPFRVRVMRLTCMSGISGLPQMTVPIGTVSGCPVGLSFIGWDGSDEVLLELAVRVGRYCGLRG